MLLRYQLVLQKLDGNFEKFKIDFVCYTLWLLFWILFLFMRMTRTSLGL